MKQFLFYKNIICIIHGLFFLHTVSAQEILKLDDANITNIDNVMNTYINNQAVTGMGVAIVYNGKVAFAKAKGLAKTNPSAVSFTTNTKSLLASISKTITGIIAMKMVKNGHLSLDASIDNYVSGYSGTAITIRHLLNHQSGIAHYGNCPDGYGGAFNSTSSLSIVQGCLICVAPPGSRKLYSTFGSTLLGVIIDKVGQAVYGKGYGQLYVDWIANPGGIVNLIPAFDNSNSNLAQGHFSNGNAETSGWDDIGWKLPAGGFISNATDLAKYAAGIMNYTFLDSVTSNSMWVNQPTSGNWVGLCQTDNFTNASIGLSFFLSSSGDDFRIFHTGSNAHGYTSYMFLYPRQRTGMVLLINKDISGAMLENIRADLESIVLCSASRNFTSEINWTGNWVYESSSTITAQNRITSTNSSFVFDAASHVTLSPGFQSVAGTYFRAVIDGCMGNIKPTNAQ